MASPTSYTDWSKDMAGVGALLAKCRRKRPLPHKTATEARQRLAHSAQELKSQRADFGLPDHARGMEATLRQHMAVVEAAEGRYLHAAQRYEAAATHWLAVEAARYGDDQRSAGDALYNGVLCTLLAGGALIQDAVATTGDATLVPPPPLPTRPVAVAAVAAATAAKEKAKAHADRAGRFFGGLADRIKREAKAKLDKGRVKEGDSELSREPSSVDLATTPQEEKNTPEVKDTKKDEAPQKADSAKDEAKVQGPPGISAYPRGAAWERPHRTKHSARIAQMLLRCGDRLRAWVCHEEACYLYSAAALFCVEEPGSVTNAVGRSEGAAAAVRGFGGNAEAEAATKSPDGWVHPRTVHAFLQAAVREVCEMCVLTQYTEAKAVATAYLVLLAPFASQPPRLPPALARLGSPLPGPYSLGVSDCDAVAALHTALLLCHLALHDTTGADAVASRMNAMCCLQVDGRLPQCVPALFAFVAAAAPLAEAHPPRGEAALAAEERLKAAAVAVARGLPPAYPALGLLAARICGILTQAPLPRALFP